MTLGLSRAAMTAAALGVVLLASPARADIIPVVGANPNVKDLGGSLSEYSISLSSILTSSLSAILTSSLDDFFSAVNFDATASAGQALSRLTNAIDDDDSGRSPIFAVGSPWPDHPSASDQTFIASSAPLSALLPIVLVGPGTGDLDRPEIGKFKQNLGLTAAQAAIPNPEPASLTLLGLGLALGARTLRRRGKK